MGYLILPRFLIASRCILQNRSFLRNQKQMKTLYCCSTVRDKFTNIISDQRFPLSLKNATDPSSVLGIYQKGASQYELTMILSRLAHVSKNAGDDVTVLSMPEFQSMVSSLNAQVTSLPIKALVSASVSLMNLYGTEDSDVLKSMHTQILWKTKTMSFAQLFGVFEIYKDRCNTDLRTQVYELSRESLLLRWVELAEPQQILSLMYTLTAGHEKQMSNLETRALDLCPRMKTKELYRTLFILAKWRHRNTPLIRSLVYHLKKEEKLSLTLPHLVNFGYAISILKVYDKKVLHSWTQSLLQLLKDSKDELSTFTFTTLLQTIGTLHWDHKELVDLVTSAVMESSRATDAACAMSLLLTCTTLHYLPEHLDLSKLSSLWDSFTLRQQIDFLWCLAVLGKLKGNEDHLKELLNPENLHKLKDEFPNGHVSYSACLVKLINLNASASYAVNDYNGQLLPDSPVNTDNIQFNLPKSRPILEKIIASLGHMAPGDKYMRRDVIHKSGHVIDIEIAANSKGEIVQLLSENNTIKKIAIKILNFNDVTLINASPIGRNHLFQQHLESDGFNVIFIPYTDFTVFDSTMKAVNYLSQKIKTMT